MSDEIERLEGNQNDRGRGAEATEETPLNRTSNESSGTSLVEDILRAKKIGAFSSLMNFLKSSIGTGILALPIAFKYCGLWVGLVALLVTSFLSTYFMHVLLRTTISVIERNDLDASKIDYAEAVFFVVKFGPTPLRKYKGKIKHTVNFFLSLTQIGFCCIYVLFISQNIDYFIRVMWPDAKLNLYLIGFIVTLFLIPAAQLRNLRALGILSGLSILTTVAGLGLIFVFLFTTGLKDYATFPSYQPFSSSLIGLSIFIFSFEGIALTLPFRNRMREPYKFTTWNGVLNTCMVIVTALCAMIGFFGYLCFGDDILGSITYNIPSDPIIYAFVKPLFIVCIFISYILQFYVPATIFARLMLKIPCHRDGSTFKQSLHRKAIRTILVVITYAIAMLVPHLDLMVSLLGAVSSTILALVIPPVLEFIHLWPQREGVRCFYFSVFFKNLVLTLVGLICLIGGTIATVVQIIETV